MSQQAEYMLAASPAMAVVHEPPADGQVPDNEYTRLVQEMAQAMRENRIDDAEALFLRLCDMDARTQEVLVFPVLFAIQRGNAMQALQQLNELPADRCPELRVLCLNVLGDPTWHAEATALLDSPDPGVRRAMQAFLGKPVEE